MSLTLKEKKTLQKVHNYYFFIVICFKYMYNTHCISFKDLSFHILLRMYILSNITLKNIQSLKYTWKL